MITALKFAMGAVSKKTILPALTHFRIENGTIRSFNGALALCAPIPLDIECTPKAEPMYRAIQNCDETISLSLTPSNKLSIKSGSFKALVDCITEDTPHAKPEGEHVDFDGEKLIEAFKVLEPFIGDDASRPWSNGVLLDGHSAYATNNVVLAQYWMGDTGLSEINVPELAIREILRIGEAPTHAQRSANSITFHYTSGRWIRSQLLDHRWPDLEAILNNPSEQHAVPDELWSALEKLKPFTDNIGRVFFVDEEVRTHLDGSAGAAYNVGGLLTGPVFNIEMLLLLKGCMRSIDFSTYPKPCMFQGDNLRGAIIGIRM